MRTQNEFKEELLRRQEQRIAAKRRRRKITVTCTSLILCLVLLAGILLKPATVVNAADLMANIKARPVAGKEADDTFIQAQTDFALRLLRACNAEENTLISPLSVMLALSMAANGADGKTKAEMEAVLGMSTEALNTYLYSYVNQITASETVKFSIANSVWYRDADFLHVKPGFLQTAMDYYAADAYKAPFDNQTIHDINDWVSRNTDGMIDKVIDKIDKRTVMYLINALMFDAEWAVPYDNESQIQSGSFTAHDGSRQAATMMAGKESIYLQDSLATGFIKYYDDPRYAFVALLPNEGVSVHDYVNSMTPESFSTLLADAQTEVVYTAMPKFSYDYDITLNDTLKAMGMTTAFDKDHADFSPMATSDRGNIFISKVLHNTHITVDTHGTRAGAATTIIFSDTTGAPSKIYYVTLDRPFVYLILDTETNLPIFMGTVLSVT